MVNAGLILGIAFIICMAAFVSYIKWYTSQIDWSKGKKLKDPLDKLKKGGIR